MNDIGVSEQSKCPPTTGKEDVLNKIFMIISNGMQGGVGFLFLPFFIVRAAGTETTEQVLAMARE